MIFRSGTWRLTEDVFYTLLRSLFIPLDAISLGVYYFREMISFVRLNIHLSTEWEKIHFRCAFHYAHDTQTNRLRVAHRLPTTEAILDHTVCNLLRTYAWSWNFEHMAWNLSIYGTKKIWHCILRPLFLSITARLYGTMLRYRRLSQSAHTTDCKHFQLQIRGLDRVPFHHSP